MAGAQTEGKAGCLLSFSGGSNVHCMGGRAELPNFNIGTPRIPESVKGKRFLMIISGPCADHCLIIDTDGNVYSWGRNEYGQCGQGRGNFDACEDLELVQGLEGINIVGGACGDQFSIVFDDKGNLYVFGERRKGQLGLGRDQMLTKASNSEWSVPTKVPGISGVVEVAAGQDFAMVRTRDGKVYATGSMEYGQTGRTGNEADSEVVMAGTGKTVRCQPVFLEVPELSKNQLNVVAIAAGAYHAVALDDIRTLWTWGKDGMGLLGQDNRKNMPVFQHKAIEVKFDNVAHHASRRVHIPLGTPLALSMYSAYAVTAHGVPGTDIDTVVVRGWGDKAGKKVKPAAMGLKHEDGGPVGTIRSMACGLNHLLVAGDKSCWSIGHATNEELGRTYQDSMGRKMPEFTYNLREVKPIPKLEGIHVAQVAAGRGFSWFLMDPEKSVEGKIKELGTFKFPVSDQNKNWKPKKKAAKSGKSTSAKSCAAAVLSPGKSVATSTEDLDDQPLAKRLPGNNKKRKDSGAATSKREAAGGEEPATKKAKKSGGRIDVVAIDTE